MFRRSLKDRVKDELIRYGGNIESINNLIEALTEIDNKLYKRSLKKKYGG
jgi:hypothetical protein